MIAGDARREQYAEAAALLGLPWRSQHHDVDSGKFVHRAGNIRLPLLREQHTSQRHVEFTHV